MSAAGEISRRELLRGVGATAASLGVVSAATGSAAAEHAETQPEYVSLTYDESRIKQYQPLLLLDNVEVRPWSYHAVIAESAESPLDVVVGFHYYPYQEGYTKHDSHLGDREPVYIYVDSETGEPVKAQYSAYHWYSNTVQWDGLQTDGPERPYFRVVPDHHHHTVHEGFVGADEAVDLEVKNLLESYPGWLDNGLEEEIHPGAVYNPQEEMQGRPYWWASNRQTLSERFFAGFYLSLGLRGAQITDLESGIL